MTKKNNDTDVQINEQVEQVEQTAQVASSFEEQFLRVSADFQNYKRRMEKDRLTWIREGMVKALEVILPLVDDLARALSASKQTSEDSSLATGIELVVKSLEKRLDELGVEGIDCSGQFDPHVHEALMEVESPDHESGQIIDVLERGYMISGNIIRHAKVSVAK